uniref:RRM domain-containing protein n=1 Tax=Fabrea salina TaxID=342563 RepID=A0A7S3IAJ8_9CILI|mmetsp:Transcript_80/g.136  ORF Transcript_80/g.136 Transcript_80/m.136 type:complete len:268 (+) Transcript_80:20-823(+)
MASAIPMPVVSNAQILSPQSNSQVSRKHPPFPIPRKESPYAWAKRAEYIEKDLAKAEYYYKEAIARGERVVSAIKDLAGVLHQQGKTQQACELLEMYRPLFLNKEASYNNLLSSLQKQLNPTGSSLNKNIKVSGLPHSADCEFVRQLFSNDLRIKEVEIESEGVAVLKFSSHSAARKTVDTYKEKEGVYILEWVSVNGEVSGPVTIRKKSNVFSFFSNGEESCEVPEYQDFSYFSRLPNVEFEDYIEEILNYSILSYVKAHDLQTLV